MKESFLKIQKCVLDAQKQHGWENVEGCEVFQSIMKQFMMQGVDEFMKFLSKEDRAKVLDLASNSELNFSDELLNNYVLDFWTNYEPEKEVA